MYNWDACTVFVRYSNLMAQLGIWNLIIQNPETFEIRTFWKSGFKRSGFQRINSYGPNHLDTRPFKIWTFFLDFTWFLIQWRPFFSKFNWSGFRILDPIQNPDHLQTNFFSTIRNLDKSRFQISTVFWPFLGTSLCTVVQLCTFLLAMYLGYRLLLCTITQSWISFWMLRAI